jgi:hypothetical protein
MMSEILQRSPKTQYQVRPLFDLSLCYDISICMSWFSKVSQMNPHNSFDNV